MKKLSKNCNIQLIIKNTNVVADTNHLCSEVYGNFCGTKNETGLQLIILETSNLNLMMI